MAKYFFSLSWLWDSWWVLHSAYRAESAVSVEQYSVDLVKRGLKKTQGNAILKLGWHPCLATHSLQAVLSPPQSSLQLRPGLSCAQSACGSALLCWGGGCSPFLLQHPCLKPSLPKTTHRVLCGFCCNKLQKAATHTGLVKADFVFCLSGGLSGAGTLCTC